MHALNLMPFLSRRTLAIEQIDFDLVQRELPGLFLNEIVVHIFEV